MTEHSGVCVCVGGVYGTQNTRGDGHDITQGAMTDKTQGGHDSQNTRAMTERTQGAMTERTQGGHDRTHGGHDRQNTEGP